jgi:lipid kinase YegS
MAEQSRGAEALSAGQQRRCRVIVQAKDALDDAFRAAVMQARDHGHTVEVRVTWELADVQRYVDEAVADGVDLIVAAGGDGSIHAVVNALVHPPAPPPCALGILPLGTGNDLATACGIDPADPVAALTLALAGTPTLVDLLLIGDRVVVNLATGGPGTRVTQETPGTLKKLLGKAAYAISGARHVVDLEAERATIVAPGLRWEGAFYVLALGNGRQAGGGMQLCPGALLNDGLLDLLIIPEMPLPQFLSLLADVRRGSHLERTEIIYRQVAQLELTSPGAMQINADGEPMEVGDVTVRVLPRALPIVLPPSAPLAEPQQASVPVKT